MNLSSSRKERERELPSSGVAWKTRGKGIGIKACQDVVRARKRIQNPPWQRCQNVIAQIVGWAKPDPIHKMVRTTRVSTYCHLR
jgi:hypothetical protein